MNKNDEYQVKINRTMLIARVFALISIVSAHIGIKSDVYVIIPKLYSYISSIGVVTFLIISGYYFNTNKYTGIMSFFRSKLRTIILPWFIFGAGAYLYKVIASGAYFDLIDLVKWVLGNGTYLYYLTVLMICYLLFFKTNRNILLISIVINIISIYFTLLGVFSPIVSNLGITNYLNIFNWIGFFAGGLLLRDFNPQNLYKFLNNSKISAPVIFVLITFCFGLFNVKTGYFTYLGPFYELIGAWMILSISTINFFDNSIFRLVSEYSFTLYLIHMVVIGTLDDFYNKFEITKLFSVLIIIVISVLVIYCGHIIACFLKLGKFYCLITGIRDFSKKELLINE